LHFDLKTSRLRPRGEAKHVERAKKTPKENAQAQVQEIAPASKIPSP
jgi:hypothetical protein